MKQPVILLFLLFGVNAFAEKLEIPYCKAVEVRDQPVGFKCKTVNYWAPSVRTKEEKEFVFEIVQKIDEIAIWKDPRGNKWAAPLKQDLTQPDAMRSCHEIGGRLPTRMQSAVARGQAFYHALFPRYNPAILRLWTSEMDHKRSNEYLQYAYFTDGVMYWPIKDPEWAFSADPATGNDFFCLIK